MNNSVKKIIIQDQTVQFCTHLRIHKYC